MCAKKAAKQASEDGFETQLKMLEEIINSLEEGDMTLEQSLSAYKQGVKIAASCRKTLNKAAHTVQIYTENNGLEDFTGE